MLEKVKKYIQQNNMIDIGETVVVGVSGGADSMCLLSVLLELGVKVYVVHINHMLRGIDADNDMEYVESFCASKGIKCFTFSYDVEAKAKIDKISCEEAGRNVRYEAFHKVMEETGSHKIAVAHNAGDNAETILHNLFRGTGVKGMVGIPPKRDEIIRPLLCVSRLEIEEYLKSKNIKYCNDVTNSQDVYTRNKIRNTIIPYVTENINANAVNHINMTGELLGEISEYIESESERIYEDIAECEEEKIKIDADKFIVQHKVIQRYIVKKAINNVANSLKDITYIHIDSVLSLFENEVGKEVHLPYSINAKKSYDKVEVYKTTKKSEQYFPKTVVEIRNFGEFLLDENGKKLIVSQFSKKEWENLSNKYEEKMYTKWLDCDILKANLVIRTRKTGDYIVVDSKGSRKKIKDLFIDLKIPKEQRDKVLLVADGNEILWVIGHRINYHYKVTDETKDIIKLEYIK